MSNHTLDSAASTLEQKHGTEVLQIASMVHLSKNLLAFYGTSNGIELKNTIKVFDKCVESHLIDRDIHPHALQAALVDLQQAGTAAAGAAPT